MARKPKPWWWKARGRWAVQLDGVRHVEPGGVAKDDLIGMAEWWESLKDKSAEQAVKTGGLTVGEVCRRYIEWDQGRVRAGRRDKSSQEGAANKLKLICRCTIRGGKVGRWRASQFKSKQFNTLVALWESEHSPGYTRALAAVLKAAFSWAAKEASGPLLRENPIAGAALPPAPMAEERFAERNEAAAWLRWLHRNQDVPRSVVLLQRCLIHTGARPSEWTRAVVGEIDTREWQIVRMKWKSAAKKKKPRRIFIPVRLRRTILRHTAGLTDESLIFLTSTGVQWNHSNLSTATAHLRRKAIAAGVPLKDQGPDRLTCYRWRHTAASELLMRGVPINTVAELLGTSAAQVARTYGHLLSGHLSAAAEVLANRKRN